MQFVVMYVNWAVKRVWGPFPTQQSAVAFADRKAEGMARDRDLFAVFPLEQPNEH